MIHERNLTYLVTTKLFWAWAESRWKCSLETGAAAFSTGLELQTPRSQGLRANLFPQKNFDVYIKNMVLIDPRGNKGTKYKLSEKTCLCWEAETVSGLEQTRFQTGFNKVAGTLNVSRNWYSISLSCDPSWDGMHSILSFFVQSFYSRRNYLHWLSLVSLAWSFICFQNFYILTSISLGGSQCSPKWIRLIIWKSVLIQALLFSYCQLLQC